MKHLDHTVRQLFFDIDIVGVNSAISLADDIATYCNSELINTFEEQLSLYENHNHTTIDFLEIDLGSVPSHEWKSLIKNKLSESLQAQLKSTLKSVGFENINSDSTRVLENNKFKEEVPEQIKKIHKNELASSLENISSDNFIEKTFFFFLEKGYLPWWYPVKTTSTIVEEYIDQFADKKSAFLLTKVQNDPKVLQRFLNATNNVDINSFSNLISVSKKFIEINLSVYKALTTTITPYLKETIFQATYREILILKHNSLFQASKKAKIFFLESILKHENIQCEINALNKKEIKVQMEAFLKKVDTIWPNLDIKKGFLKNKIALVKNFSVKNSKPYSKLKTKPKINIEDIGKPSKEVNNSVGKQKTEIKKAVADKVSEFNQNQPGSIENEEIEGVYVQHAGIVLLHPFLPSFFSKLNLLENGQWKNEESSKKAVQLLAYLSTGAMQCPEYELLLFKHLCGVSWDTLIEAELELSSDEIKEADSLLQSVLEHWTALKNTSIDGLREGFIERDGKLWKEQNSWQLYIEQKGQDILLQQLPWGLGMLKFPWLKELLIINWI